MEWILVVRDLKERCESYGLNLFEVGSHLLDLLITSINKPLMLATCCNCMLELDFLNIRVLTSERSILANSQFIC